MKYADEMLTEERCNLRRKPHRRSTCVAVLVRCRGCPVIEGEEVRREPWEERNEG